MRSILVVANQTLEADRLTEALLSRLEDEACRFHVLVPVRDGDSDEDAKERLTHLTDAVTAAGGQATGELGPPDALEAICDRLLDDEFDEVIVSTLPQGASRWLDMDLPSRIEHGFEVPVTTIVTADESA